MLKADPTDWLLEQDNPVVRCPNCRRMRPFFPAKGQPYKWVTPKAIALLRRGTRSGLDITP